MHYVSLGGKEPDQAWRPSLNPNIQILAERRAQGRLFRIRAKAVV